MLTLWRRKEMVDKQLEHKWNILCPSGQELWKKYFATLNLSFQQQNILLDIWLDFQSWGELANLQLWPQHYCERYQAKILSKQIVQFYQQQHGQVACQKKSYTEKPVVEKSPISFGVIGEEERVLGRCPVASEKTRCCNLLTLDVVRSCGFDCTYCSIQSFFHEDRVDIEDHLAEKLQQLDLDPNKLYHIGTGQSSDSLMWGNRDGLLDSLLEFARSHPNVILEFKTKSHNISYFLQNDIPKNILLTWSLNPQAVIDVEERLTSSLQQRLEAAKLVSQRGILVGFHFHPMIYFDGFEQQYKNICTWLLDNFQAEQVALVSLGTVTFTKKVMKQIRERGIYTKILQMEFDPVGGKFSYPLEIKREMFSLLYQSLQPWHEQVYFYMCMEDQSLWQTVFGFEYKNNNEFEQEMLTKYFTAINNNLK